MLTVLNNQKKEAMERRVDGLLAVHSMFPTIQGEGPFTGHAALFIRLAGCNLQCPHCDTVYADRRTHHMPDQILETASAFYNWKSGLVVITGGEPFRQNITPLVRALLDRYYDVQIETNGTLYPGDDFPWDADDPSVTVVCSPKTGQIHPKTATRVTAYKYVLSRTNVHPDGLPTNALGHPLGRLKTVARPPSGWVGDVYLNPMDAKDKVENKLNMKAVVDSVMKNRGWLVPDQQRLIAGVQMHKILELP